MAKELRDIVPLNELVGKDKLSKIQFYHKASLRGDNGPMGAMTALSHHYNYSRAKSLRGMLRAKRDQKKWAYDNPDRLNPNTTRKNTMMMTAPDREAKHKDNYWGATKDQRKFDIVRVRANVKK